MMSGRVTEFVRKNQSSSAESLKFLINLLFLLVLIKIFFVAKSGIDIAIIKSGVV